MSIHSHSSSSCENNCLQQTPKENTSIYTIMIAILSRILIISYAAWISATDANHEFDPLPETSVCAFCRWQVQLNTDPMRIPSTITEVVCQNPYAACRGNTNYQCKQIHAKMVIAYTSPYLYKQNTTISIGCACVRRRLNNILFRNAPVEKRTVTDMLS